MSFEEKLWTGPWPPKALYLGVLLRKGLERGLIFEIEGRKTLGLHGSLQMYHPSTEDQIIPPME
jgi:hypothetical protein